MGGGVHLIKILKKISKRSKNQGSKQFYILLELSPSSDWGFLREIRIKHLGSFVERRSYDYEFVVPKILVLQQIKSIQMSPKINALFRTLHCTSLSHAAEFDMDSTTQQQMVQFSASRVRV